MFSGLSKSETFTSKVRSRRFPGEINAQGFLTQPIAAGYAHQGKPLATHPALTSNQT